jgi:hypothetical protein
MAWFFVVLLRLTLLSDEQISRFAMTSTPYQLTETLMPLQLSTSKHSRLFRLCLCFSIRYGVGLCVFGCWLKEFVVLKGVVGYSMYMAGWWGIAVGARFLGSYLFWSSSL